MIMMMMMMIIIIIIIIIIIMVYWYLDIAPIGRIEIKTKHIAHSTSIEIQHLNDKLICKITKQNTKQAKCTHVFNN